MCQRGAGDEDRKLSRSSAAACLGQLYASPSSQLTGGGSPSRGPDSSVDGGLRSSALVPAENEDEEGAPTARSSQQPERPPVVNV
jgi:hypothetical protein